NAEGGDLARMQTVFANREHAPEPRRCEREGCSEVIRERLDTREVLRVTEDAQSHQAASDHDEQRRARLPPTRGWPAPRFGAARHSLADRVESQGAEHADGNRPEAHQTAGDPEHREYGVVDCVEPSTGCERER